METRWTSTQLNDVQGLRSARNNWCFELLNLSAHFKFWIVQFWFILNWLIT